LAEHIQKRILNPIEEALAFKRYVSDYGWGGMSELGRNLGKSTSYISKRINLLNLPSEMLFDPELIRASQKNCFM
jgi:ParB family chromosome partitioning protein